MIRMLRMALLSVALFAGITSSALSKDKEPAKGSHLVLNKIQIQNFRDWFVVILRHQIERGPNPRWKQRDCAGLVRFAVSESLHLHSNSWRKANGLVGRAMPPEIELSSEQQVWVNLWNQIGGNKGSFVKASGLIQENSKFISKELVDAKPGDLLYFDQGMEQHLMVWTGRDIIYHKGSYSKKDNGLRQVTYSQLNHWKDTRWQLGSDNPNFVGFFRLAFL